MTTISIIRRILYVLSTVAIAILAAYAIFILRIVI